MVVWYTYKLPLIQITPLPPPLNYTYNTNYKRGGGRGRGGERERKYIRSENKNYKGYDRGIRRLPPSSSPIYRILPLLYVKAEHV